MRPNDGSGFASPRPEAVVKVTRFEARLVHVLSPRKRSGGVAARWNEVCRSLQIGTAYMPARAR